LALRSTASKVQGGYEWAVAEAKGTQVSLTDMAVCPTNWSNQARNVTISIDGSQIPIPRHMVIATRVNPNAGRLKTRRLQVRAWNRHLQPDEPQLPSEAAIEIAAAHIFGLFRGLRLEANALAIALSVQRRAGTLGARMFDFFSTDANRIFDSADRELDERSIKQPPTVGAIPAELISVETELGPIAVTLAEPLIALARRLRQVETHDAAAKVLSEADSALDKWESSLRTAKPEHGGTILPSGIEIRLPRDFEPH